MNWLNLIDKVFVVSLPERVDRRELVSKELEKYNIQFEFYDAIKHDNGARGLLMTMHKLFKECEEKQYQRVLILEDDVYYLCEDVDSVMNKALVQVPNDFWYMFLGCNLITPPSKFSDNVLKINGAYSTHAILYSAMGIKMILSYFNDYTKNGYEGIKPYDVMLMENIQGYGKTYCVHPMVASQRIGYSDIEKKQIDWDTMMKQRNEMFTKKFTLL